MISLDIEQIKALLGLIAVCLPHISKAPMSIKLQINIKCI